MTTPILALNQLIDPNNWTSDNLSRFSASQIRKLATYFPGVSSKLEDETLLTFYTRFPPSAADRKMALTLCGSSLMKGMSYKKPDQHIISAGGSFKTIGSKIYESSGESRDHTLVPVPPKHVAKFGSIHRVAIFFSQLMKVNEAKIVTRTLDSCRTVFKSSCVDLVACQTLATTLAKYLMTTPSWQGKDAVAQNSLSGMLFLTFVFEEMNKMTPGTYYFFVQGMILNCLGAYVKQGDDWYEGEPDVIAAIQELPASVQALADSKVVMQAYSAPNLFDIVRGIRPKLTIPVIKTPKEMIKESQNVVSFGGADSTVSMLNGMAGYSCYMTDIGKRVSFLVSCALSCLLRDDPNPVMVNANTVGDIPLLVASLGGNLIHHGRSDLMGEQYFRVYVPDLNKINKVAAAYKQFCVSARSNQYTFVMYSDVTFPSAVTQGAAIDYELQALSCLPADFHYGGKFIISTRVWGSCWWQKQERPNSTTEYTFFKGVKVYMWGDASEGRAVVSQYSNLQLVERDFGRATKQLTHTALHQVKSEADWYTIVYNAIGRRYTYWLNPVVFNSGISNLLEQTKKGADASNTTQFEELTGISPSNVVAGPVIRVVTGKKMTASTGKVVISSTTTTTTTTALSSTAPGNATSDLVQTSAQKKKKDKKKKVAQRSASDDDALAVKPGNGTESKIKWAVKTTNDLVIPPSTPTPAVPPLQVEVSLALQDNAPLKDQDDMPLQDKADSVAPPLDEKRNNNPTPDLPPGMVVPQGEDNVF